MFIAKSNRETSVSKYRRGNPKTKQRIRLGPPETLQLLVKSNKLSVDTSQSGTKSRN